MIRVDTCRSRWLWAFLLVSSITLLQGPALVRSQPAPQPTSPAPNVPTAAEQMALMAQHYTPELRQKVMALSPDVRQALQQLQVGHTRRSEVLTLRQVMQEILADYQSILAAIAMDNAEHAAESARRLANHRLPRGGLLPYLSLDKITTETLAVLPAMNAAVEGNATQLAQASRAGRYGQSGPFTRRHRGGVRGLSSGVPGCPGDIRAAPAAASDTTRQMNHRRKEDEP